MNNDLGDPAGTAQLKMTILASKQQDGDEELVLTQHDCRQYLYMYSGAGSIELDGVSWQIGPGSVALIPSDTEFRLRTSRHSQIMLMTAREEFIRSKVLPSLQVPTGIYWKTYHTPMVFQRWAGAGKRSMRRRVWYELEGALDRVRPSTAAAIAAYVIVVLCDRIREDENFEAGRSGAILAEDGTLGGAGLHHTARTTRDELVMRFRTLVEESFRQHLSVRDYCSKLGVSVARLTRSANAVMERTPLAIIHDRLLLEAKRELTYSAQSISQISYGLGFSEPAYFCRFFRRGTGQAPNEARHIIRNRIEAA